jgi:16S rRNA (guanine527-N7)-methyltransferase
LLPLLARTDSHIVDVGSGGGLPAIPLAIALRDTGRRFLLVEPNARKVSFLRTVARELELPNVQVESQRLEEIEAVEADVITSRALARLGELFAMFAPRWLPKTRALLHKGREYVDELDESDASWIADVIVHPSTTDASGVILEVANLRLRSK